MQEPKQAPEISGGDPPGPGPRLLEHFDAQVKRSPERVALIEGSQSIRFGELADRAARVSGGLRSAGVGPGGLVGLHLERSIDWVVAVLAILRANATVVPLPPSFPPERLRELLEFLQLDRVIDGAASPLQVRGSAPVVSFEDLQAGARDGPPFDPGDPDRAAFVLASSGSTGKPKLIVRSQRSFFHRLEWTWNTHPYAPDEVCCQKAHVTTTHGIYELFEPLLRGTTQVIIPDDTVRNLERFWETLREHRVSRLLIVPSMLRASLDMPEFRAPPLKVLVLMGEYVAPALAERALQAFPEATRIYSIYGSTEASSALVCDLREDFRPGRELALGRPITPDVEPLVLNGDLEPVAPGASGRLFMAGDLLFSGYFRDPELSASVLLAVPGRAWPVFDTRDQVRRTANGELEFVGRVDDTVKIRGFRVDLQDVERALLTHPGVTQGAVVAAHGSAGDTSLLAFVTPPHIDRQGLFETLRERLPPYMVPASIMPLEALPLTASRKVDRARLLAEHGTPTHEAGEDRVLTKTEATVRAAWEETLGHGGFDRQTSFFEAGGTSLNVFSLVNRLRLTFGLEREQLDEQSVYRFSSVQDLAARIDALRAGDAEAAGSTPLLVVMRQGTDPDQPPLFLVATPGGTVGAYEKLVRRLETTRDVIGVRDPFLWGERDPTAGFQSWVHQYVDAIQARQPRGPYAIGAYSSAGSFGIEIARHLRAAGEDVGLLVLIDPFGIDNRGPWSFGHRAMHAMWARTPIRWLIRAAGRLRPLVAGPLRNAAGKVVNETRISDAEFEALVREKTRDGAHLALISGAMELNTGLPLSVTEADLEGLAPEDYLSVLQRRLQKHIPGFDPAMVEAMVVQYSMQVTCQNHYRLKPYDGPVLLAEPETHYAGVLAAQLRPFFDGLESLVLPLDEPGERERMLGDRFGVWQYHFRCMRDDAFVEKLAAALGQRLGQGA